MKCNKAQVRMRALLSITLILFLGPKKDFKDICPQELIQWLDGVYEVSFDRGDGILKSELFEKVANHFNVEKSTLNQRALFECLGRHVFGKHHSFKNVKLTRGKKQIKGIIQRSQGRLAPADEETPQADLDFPVDQPEQGQAQAAVEDQIQTPHSLQDQAEAAVEDQIQTTDSL